MTQRVLAIMQNMLGTIAVAAICGLCGALWAMRSELSEIRGEMSSIKQLVLQHVSDGVKAKK